MPISITKAIIPVAGWGTRRLPVTKAIEKCMLPIGNRPVVDYVVQDCILAGITDIYFVVSEGSTQLQTYYTPHEKLEAYLERSGKDTALAQTTPPHITFHYIVQPDDNKYGTSIPVSLVMPHIDDGESVAVLMGDDCLYRSDGESEVARLITAAGDNSSMLGVNVPLSEVSRYGVIQSNDHGEFLNIVEKPSPENTPSTYINVSKYVFNYDALQRIHRHANQENVKGEYQITDPINDYVANNGVLRVVPAEGQYLDSGTVEGWLRANEVVIRGV